MPSSLHRMPLATMNSTSSAIRSGDISAKPGTLSTEGNHCDRPMPRSWRIKAINCWARISVHVLGRAWEGICFMESKEELMASIVNDPGGRKRIQFVNANGDRKAVRLGKVSKRSAEGVKYRIEQLLECQLLKRPMEADLAAWVNDLDTAHGKETG